MTEEQADELSRLADATARSFWEAFESFCAGRKAAAAPGGAQVFAAALVESFREEMTERQIAEQDLRGVLAQVAGVGLEYLAPGSSKSVDLSGLSPSAPLVSPFANIEGPLTVGQTPSGN
jgi:hypothetical protein